KNSNKILLTTILAILVIVAGLIISSRIIITKVPDRSMKYSDEDFISKTLDLADFDAIETSGIWQVEIYHGNEYSVTLYYPVSESREIDVHTRDNQLRLKNDMKWQRQRKLFRATITMPELSSLRTEDGASITFYDFDCDELDIKITGAAEIDARNSRIENLKLRCEGAADANFKDSEVVNAKLNINGASRITLTMAGGKLTGNAHGASSIVYYGEVSTQDIATAGAVSVRHR
ncbi:MAG: DUF2807 domain-containing protein, partial [Candidatus Marinimicrobia bacterium]|nr:DUF2807 domain-containing protein [Candidatus Neomarinimicrobiota bacterium]